MAQKDSNASRTEGAELWMPQEAADYLRISIDFLTSLRKRGLIPYVQLGRRDFRYIGDELEAWCRAGGIQTMDKTLRRPASPHELFASAPPRRRSDPDEYRESWRDDPRYFRDGDGD